MRDSKERYDLYRIYSLDQETAKLRIKCDMREFGTSVLQSLEGLPSGITVDSISVKPETLDFDNETTIEIPESNDDLLF